MPHAMTAESAMLDVIKLWVDKLSYRAAPLSRLPKADVRGTLLNAHTLGLRPRHLLDIGANKGKWSAIAKRTFPDCAITLIEPQREMATRLDAFCRKYPDCRWVCCGVGSHNGEAEFTVNPNTVGSSFNISPETAQKHAWERRMVPIYTVDHLVQEAGHVPEIVKIDAEGNEFQILMQADCLWGKTELIFVEVNYINDKPLTNGFVEMVKFMDERDYVPFDFSWFCKSKTGRLSIGEVAFVPRKGVLRRVPAAPATKKLAA
jgi:FkbM family methyltransferase